MRIWALCSWYDEQPDHLREMVESVAPLVNGVVAVDGAYALYPNARQFSDRAQWNIIADTAEKHGLLWEVRGRTRQWSGEVEKRAFMFESALQVATSHEDWFLIMDGDMLLDPSVDTLKARATLATTPCDVAEVTFAELAYGSSTHTIHATGLPVPVPGAARADRRRHALALHRPGLFAAFWPTVPVAWHHEAGEYP
jgi:hypothetical protein